MSVTIDPPTALVFATIGLVVVTLIYAVYTAKLARATDLARKEQIKPIVRALFTFEGPVFTYLRCQNLGRGSATGIDVDIEVYPLSLLANRKWKEPVLPPLGFTDFFLPYATIDDVRSKIDYIVIKGECKDVFGIKETIYDRLDVKYFLDHFSSAHIRLVETANEHLKDIAQNTENIGIFLGEIEKKLEKINSAP